MIWLTVLKYYIKSKIRKILETTIYNIKYYSWGDIGWFYLYYSSLLTMSFYATLYLTAMIAKLFGYDEEGKKIEKEKLTLKYFFTCLCIFIFLHPCCYYVIKPFRKG